MSRFDLTGLFWDDYVPPKERVEKVKREPPEPVWLADDYLPHYAEASAWVPDCMSDAELMRARDERHRLVWDTEFYPNYALLGFMDLETGKLLAFDRTDTDDFGIRGEDKLRWVAQNFTLVGFNDTAFDVPMLHAALDGMYTEALMECVTQLIVGQYGDGTRPAQFYRDRRLTPFPVDNIDLIALTPLGPSLKVCAGRLHTPRMADLPFQVGKRLSEPQKTVLRWYWANDLHNTAHLYKCHRKAIELRELLSAEYGVDVRSKSDPQIAEAVIRKEIQARTGQRYIRRAQIIPWRSFRYQPPPTLRYQSETMRWVLDFVAQQDFVVDDKGSATMPPGLAKLDVRIGGMTYRMGIGGLHSQEKRTVHLATDEVELTDHDVTSYYPMLIIQQGMYPPNVGPEFLHTYVNLKDRRVTAKRAGDKGTAETLKIVLNGTFGKTNEKGGFSVVYYPEMMIQVTLSGQLSLLMLIERLELAGISVVSANTDGIMVKCPRALAPLRDEVMAQWERDTGLGLEAKRYRAVYSRDVNNYVAVYAEPDPKGSGVWAHAKTVGAYRQTMDVYPPKWNPTCEVCAEAVVANLALGTPPEEYVAACSDFRKFVEVRRITGGAFKDGEYLGKAVRWYYSTQSPGEIVNATNGYTVPRSTGARPCMTLLDALPEDLDLEYYARRARDMVADLFPRD